MDRRLTELADQLSQELAESGPADASFERLLEGLSAGPVPVGRLNRAWTLGSLQAKIAAGYVAHWFRAGYGDADSRQASLNEARLKAALRLLGSMGYLRGAIMKLGQVLAHYPNIVPMEFASLLGRFHSEAPPMHFSLLREFVRGELGADPEQLFDDFEPRAFAAASLGQVHRARLKGSRQPVAIKIQYPNIGRTISDDFRNLRALMAPMRLSSDWNNVLAQMNEIHRMLEVEIDYVQEAEHLRIARTAFEEDGGNRRARGLSGSVDPPRAHDGLPRRSPPEGISRRRSVSEQPGQLRFPHRAGGLPALLQQTATVCRSPSRQLFFHARRPARPGRFRLLPPVLRRGHGLFGRDGTVGVRVSGCGASGLGAGRGSTRRKPVRPRSPAAARALRRLALGTGPSTRGPSTSGIPTTSGAEWKPTAS